MTKEDSWGQFLRLPHSMADMCSSTYIYMYALTGVFIHTHFKTLNKHLKTHIRFHCSIHKAQSQIQGMERWFHGKSICCSFRGPRFKSQHPHGGSQPSITLVLEDQLTSSGLCEYQTCTQTYKHTCKQNTHRHKFKKIT